MSYMGGLFNLTLVPWSVGASVAIMNRGEPNLVLGFWRRTQNLGVNVIWITPALLKSLLLRSRQRLPSATETPAMKGAFVSTAPIDLNAKVQFEQQFSVDLYECYGLTEGLFLAMETSSQRDRAEGSVGRPAARTTFRIEPLPDLGGVIGEVLVQNPYLLESYITDDGQEQSPLSEDGFFRTGDIGYMNDQGLLVLHGRLKEVAVSGGYTIMLREVECVALAHDGVLEAAAVAQQHSVRGDVIELFLLPIEGVRASVLKSEVQHLLETNLSPHKRPKRIRVASELPRTPSGKVIKTLLIKNPLATALS